MDCAFCINNYERGISKRFKKLTAGIVAASLALSTLAQSAIAGGITFSDDQWWTQMSINRDDLLEGYYPVDVSSITFYSQTDYMLGYYSTSSGECEQNSYDANTRYDISDIQLYDSEEQSYALNAILSRACRQEYCKSTERITIICNYSDCR